MTVASPKARRMLIIRSQAFDEGGDGVVGDFVRPIWGGALGFIESISDGWATVLIVKNAHGHREIIETRFLKRVSR